jgi:REP element-mobilizing transposase RayT
MRDDYEEAEFPIAYLITFRTYGTWLHGDDRKSTRRKRLPRTYTKMIAPNVPLHERMREKMNTPPVVFDRRQRKAVRDAITELCRERGYTLYALNVRTNHVHVVIGVRAKPERVADALKAFSTRRLRELGLIGSNERVWSRGRSRRYLWKPRHVAAAVDYVLYCQSDEPFDLDD